MTRHARQATWEFQVKVAGSDADASVWRVGVAQAEDMIERGVMEGDEGKEFVEELTVRESLACS